MSNFRRTEIERIIGYSFSNGRLLERAFVHSSYSNEKGIQSNENLEFLGDSVLGLIVSEILYKKFGGSKSNHSEGKLTEMRRAIVSKEPLNNVVTELKLEKYVIFGQGEERKDHSGSKLLSNLYEAVVGAIYLDGGLSSASKFVESSLSRTIDEALSSKGEKSYKNSLQEYAQKNGLGLPVYTTKSFEEARVGKFVSSVYVNGNLLGQGIDSTKKGAELLAARDALTKIFKLKH